MWLGTKILDAGSPRAGGMGDLVTAGVLACHGIVRVVSDVRGSSRRTYRSGRTCRGCCSGWAAAEG